jgi:TonB family protein
MAPRLRHMLVLSALLHAAALLAGDGTQWAVAARQDTTLSVTLDDGAADAPAADAPRGVRGPAHASRPKAARVSATARLAIAQARPAAPVALGSADTPIPPVSRANDGTPDGVNDATPDTAAGAARIHARLLDLTRHFDYPHLAHLHGWEGRVLLSVAVARDGRLQQVALAHSSGFAVLDASALHSLRQVGRVYADDVALPAEGVALQLGVNYRLEGDR